MDVDAERPIRQGQSSALRGPGMTKHSLIADALSSEIQTGKYKVGDLLPSEPELSLRFGVSRHTVRTALRSLHEIGLVSSMQGVGTQVQGSKPSSHYSHAFSSAEDLLQYATSTRVRVVDHQQVLVDQDMASQFGCKPGEHWWRIRTVRSEPLSRVVVAYSEIHIPLAFGAVVEEALKSKQPVFALIEQRFQEKILEIQQEISCLSQMPTEVSTLLKLAPQSPGMQITRRYLGKGGRVLEVARTVHPSDRFKYAMRVQLRHGA
jgi:GntR family transcriptional regulator